MTAGAAPDPAAVATSSAPHLAYIDCIRGYAVLLVITCHLTYVYPELPWPVHRLTAMGWHGVQLFFLASAMTLMMSWHNEVRRNGSVDIAAFFIRRYFRIAPAYYAAAVLYFLIMPPAGGFDLGQLLASSLFINAWTPDLMPTTAAWKVVPGGWSIGVEFTFYALFPLLAAWVTDFQRGAVLLAAAVLAGAVANDVQIVRLADHFETAPLLNFLYFWFPNQAVVFVIGSMLFLLLRAPSIAGRLARIRYGNLVAVLALLGSFCVTYLGGSGRLALSAAIPTYLYASVILAVFVVAMAHARPGLMVNRPMAFVGQVSFSAYLSHFAVLRLLPERFPALFHTEASGFAAIAAFAYTWIIVVGVTVALSWCGFRIIEQPGIALGRILIAFRRRQPLPIGPA